MAYNTLLAITDLETMGLNGKQPCGRLGQDIYPIVEICIRVVNAQLENVCAPFQRVIHYDEPYIKTHSSERALQMHTDSGLMQEVYDSKHSLTEVEEAACAFLYDCGIDHFGNRNVNDIEGDTYGYLTGNNISFDRDFIDAQMPKLKDHLHYNTVDVSTMRIGARLFLGMPKLVGKTYGHRTESDTQETLNELDAFRKVLTGETPRTNFS